MKKLNIILILSLLLCSLNAKALMCSNNLNSKHPEISANTHYYAVNVVNNINEKREATGNGEILDAAEDTLGDGSSDIAGCGHGRLACAAMVTRVLNRAGVSGIHSNCTSDMYDQLENSNRFERVSVSAACPGDIIISPSEGHRCGHVGIVGRHGKVYSNNSYSARFDASLTIGIWRSYFGGHKGLGVYVYRRV